MSQAPFHTPLIPPPFLSHLGGRIDEREDCIEVTLELKPEHCNSRKVAHGGVMMTLLDVCMARAARAKRRLDGQDDHGASKIEKKTSFMHPGLGPVLVARAYACSARPRWPFARGRFEIPPAISSRGPPAPSSS
jgi:acyl-coenzyme A thioesterase PaaI-like protein